MHNYIPIEAKPHTPPYQIHRYFARRPWNVFSELIKNYSDEKDIILDPFCGGGVTIYEGLKLKRKMIGFDINPLSIFIVQNMIRKTWNSKELDGAYRSCINYLNILYGDFNTIQDIKGQNRLQPKRISIDWNELAFLARCNLCKKVTTLSNANKIKNGRYYCENPQCKASKDSKGYIEPKNCERAGYKYLFSVGMYTKKQCAHEEYSELRKETVEKHIFFLKAHIKDEKIEIPHDKIPLNWDRQFEDLLAKKGIIMFQDLFTERNLLINLLLLNHIKKLNVSDETKMILRLIFSSSLRDTNIMAFTHEGWQSGKPTTWSKHAYWIPNQFCEVNIIPAFKHAFERMKKCLEFNAQLNYEIKQTTTPQELKKDNNLVLYNSTITDVKINAEFVDEIITDPPYGSNVQYLELSHFWYPWNKELYDNITPDFSKEAISNRKKKFEGAKNLQDYENNLYAVFKECYYSLKSERNMILTFNNKDMGAWLALMISIFKAGFSLEDKGLYFQTGVKNYKQTAHTKSKGSPYGDFIYVFIKTKTNILALYPNITNDDELIEQLDKTLIKHLEQYKNSKEKNKNDIIKTMVLQIMPVLEYYVKRVLKDGTHKIYEKYKTNHLEKIYGGSDDKEEQ